MTPSLEPTSVRPSRARRAGASLLELQVAMIVLGVAVTGLCPLVVMQARLARKLETQPVGPDNPQVIRGVRMLDGSPFSGQGFAAAPPATVLQPQPDGWVRRLGVAASFAVERPGAAVHAAAGPDRPRRRRRLGLLGERLVDRHRRLGQRRRLSFPARRLGERAGQSGPSAGSSPAGITSWPRGCRRPRTPRTRPTRSPTRRTTRSRFPSTRPPAPAARLVWTDLGVYYLDATFQVTLAGSTSGTVIADAIQLVPAGALNSVTITTPAATTSDGATVRVRVVGQ